MTISRRDFLVGAVGIAGAAGVWTKQASSYSGSALDRRALVARHNPVLTKLDPLSPLTLGNGEFAFTADITGLQTFPREHEQAMPLCTMSQWGWHTKPLPAGLDPKQFRLTQYDTYGRPVGYATGSDGQRELFDWLRENPHRLHLGQVGLRLRHGDEGAGPANISDIRQELDLLSGTLKSRFSLAGELISVRTAVHPEHDLLAVEIRSNLVRAGRTGRLGVRFGFPYASPEMKAADWTKFKDHRSTVISKSGHAVRLYRQLDSDEYHVAVEWTGEASFDEDDVHQFILHPAGTAEILTFVMAFS